MQSKIMENKKKVGVGVIGLLTILSAFGGGMFLSQDELNMAYICSATNEIGIFAGGVSQTQLTAYPFLENRSDYVRCKKDGVSGTWIKLSDYAEEQGIDILDLLIPRNETIEGNVVNVQYNGQKYSCVFTNEIINGSIISTSKCEKVD